MLSQLSRYGTVHKLKVGEMRMSVTTRWHIEGSVLGGTLQSAPLVFDVRVEVEADEPEERIAEMLRVAEQSCYVIQTLKAPLERSFSLNGEPLTVSA